MKSKSLYIYILSFVAVVFLELWTRKQAVIAWQWDLTKFEEDEPLRPQYEATVQTKRYEKDSRTLKKIALKLYNFPRIIDFIIQRLYFISELIR